jgi:hypothetical protein
MDELVEHEAGEGQKVQARQQARQALVIAGEAAEARAPGDATLDAASGGAGARTLAWPQVWIGGPPLTTKRPAHRSIKWGRA